ncbi:MAG: hypothetical protein FD133_821 [Erysipelotrichaceae bacterium]|nr:MAG: hypothetical protein FD179_968 [Erysipelotrichaceae bacterium]TXT18459.1 MAG: hypothetical protein FD133_821 [Erysipelotrichaceae bacterium]
MQSRGFFEVCPDIILNVAKGPDNSAVVCVDLAGADTLIPTIGFLRSS